MAGGRANWSRFWLILLGLLLLNWLLGSLLVSAVRPAVSYTFFLGQVNANNVQTVTSTGDAIQGTFRHQVAYPPGSNDARQVEQFNTQRPTFADDKSRQGRLGYDRRPGPGRRRIALAAAVRSDRVCTSQHQQNPRRRVTAARRSARRLRLRQLTNDQAGIPAPEHTATPDQLTGNEPTARPRPSRRSARK